MDDIVTRLREHQKGFRLIVGVNDAIQYPSLYNEAADEIELLRDALIECESTISRLEIELKYKEVRGE